MIQKLDHIDVSEPVSTVTKHIKIYSDNPIHDCIDRIIESSAMLDAINTDKQYHLALLREAAEDLSAVCVNNEYKLITDYIDQSYTEILA